MAIYKCAVCGAVFDEDKEGKKLSELDCCPVCKQPVSKFEKVGDETPQEESSPQGELAYDPQYMRHDKNSRFACIDFCRRKAARSWITCFILCQRIFSYRWLLQTNFYIEIVSAGCFP